MDPAAHNQSVPPPAAAPQAMLVAFLDRQRELCSERSRVERQRPEAELGAVGGHPPRDGQAPRVRGAEGGFRRSSRARILLLPGSNPILTPIGASSRGNVRSDPCSLPRGDRSFPGDHGRCGPGRSAQEARQQSDARLDPDPVPQDPGGAPPQRPRRHSAGVDRRPPWRLARRTSLAVSAPGFTGRSVMAIAVQDQDLSASVFCRRLTPAPTGRRLPPASRQSALPQLAHRRPRHRPHRSVGSTHLRGAGGDPDRE